MKKILTTSFFVALGIVWLATCSRLPDEGLMEKGKNYEAQEKFSEAIDSYKKLVKLYPRSPLAAEALYRAGLVYTNGLQDFESAISTMSRVLEDYPESPSAAPCQFMIGFIYANNAADTVNARMAYNTFLQNYPDHELASSVEWELRYLGKDINDIPELKALETETQTGENGSD